MLHRKAHLSFILLVFFAVPTSGLQEKPLHYLDIVDMYRRRQYDEALEQVRKLNPQRIMDMLARWEDLTSPPMDYRRTGVRVSGIEDLSFRPGDGPLQAAALMHTDFAMQLVNELKFISAGFQLDIADRTIERIANNIKRESCRRDWLLALGYFYQTTKFKLGVDGFEDAKRFYDEAVKRFPSDAEILLSAGTLYEHSGSQRYGEKNYLIKARDLYRLAIDVDPELAEAHLRYGRVLEKRGEFEKAKEPLQTALEFNESPLINYVALLVLGQIAEREKDFDAAVGRYQAALDLLPEWQVAYVALSHLLHSLGRNKESADILAKTMEAPFTSPQNFDGWMVYEEGRTNRLGVLLQKMREEVSY